MSTEDRGTLPELETGAAVAADLAYVEATGPTYYRVTAALRAYLWAQGRPGWTLEELRELLAEADLNRPTMGAMRDA